MEFEKLSAQTRSGRKKGTARQLRRDGFIPAVCYGRDIDPITLSVDPKALSEVMAGPLGRNIVIKMDVEGDGSPSEPILVMLQDYQYHPVSRQVLHADFLQVSMEREVHVRVPFEVYGRSVGVQAGGMIARVFRTLPVCCHPDKIPEKLEIDVTEMDLGDIRKVSDLDLPEGVTIEYEPNRTVISVMAPTLAATTEETEEEEEEGAEEETPAADQEEK